MDYFTIFQRKGYTLCCVGKYLLLLLLCFPASLLHVQGFEADSLPAGRPSGTEWHAMLLPASLLVTGSLMNAGAIKFRVNEALGGITHTHIDDYLEFGPLVELAGADAAGCKAQHGIPEQLKYLVATEIIGTGIVQAVKRMTNIRRPDGTNYSFPSGHTTQAFAGATLLFMEFHESCLPLALSGYGLALTTGFLRMTNNRHWLPDVVAGAGLGILVPWLLESIASFREWHPFQAAPAQVSLYPGTAAGFAQTGVTLRITFR